MGDTVLITGLGTLGKEVLRQLAAVENVHVVGCDIDERRGRQTCHYMNQLGISNGHDPDVTFQQLDLDSIEDIKAVIETYEPDLVFQSATSFSNRLFDHIDDEVKEVLLEQAGMGWLAPMHLRFPINVAKALRETGQFEETFFVNASFPDVVNPVLDRLDMTPDCGIGNVGTFIPIFESAAAERANEPRTDIEMYVVMSHGVSTRFWNQQDTDGGPYYVKVLCRGEDITAEVDEGGKLGTEGWPELPQLGDSITMRRPLVAANAVDIIVGSLRDSEKIVHGPAPNGRVGGWPFRVSRSGVETIVPAGVTLEELQQINQDGMKEDGIERIEDDGTIVYRESNAELVADEIGYDCRRLEPDTIGDREDEIRDRLGEMVDL